MAYVKFKKVFKVKLHFKNFFEFSCFQNRQAALQKHFYCFIVMLRFPVIIAPLHCGQRKALFEVIYDSNALQWNKIHMIKMVISRRSSNDLLK